MYRFEGVQRKKSKSTKHPVGNKSGVNVSKQEVGGSSAMISKPDAVITLDSML